MSVAHLLAAAIAVSALAYCNSHQTQPEGGSASPGSTGSLQDPALCDGACQAAQGACKSHPAKPLDYCLGKCRATAPTMSVPSVDCLAIGFTCDENCP